MPHGDGCTEWFRIEALPEIVRFLEGEGKRLGVAMVRPLPPKPSQTQKPTPSLVKESFAGQWAKATEHNARVFDWVKSTLQDMYAANIIAGIRPPAHRHGFLGDGHMCLQGHSCVSAYHYLMSDEVFVDGLSTLHGPGRWLGSFSRVFCGGLMIGDIEFARINISGTFLSSALPDNYERVFPNAEAIRAYLYPLVAKVDSPECKALWLIDRRLEVEEARSSREFYAPRAYPQH